METKILWSKEAKKSLYEEFNTRVSILKGMNVIPKLVVIQVGSDGASNVYIKHKRIAAEQLGIEFKKVSLDKGTSFQKLKEIVDEFNDDINVDGIIVQFPLPKQFSKSVISTLVSPEKDADGGHPFNQGINYTKQNLYAPEPCTPKGVMSLLEFYGIEIEGKNAVVIGRSNIAGRPMAYMLSNKNATVSLLHTRTDEKAYANLIKGADIIVSATGVKDTVTPSMIKEGATLVDIGIIRDGKNLRGDFEWKEFIGKAGAITPVPGGVGPMTVTMLMGNVITLAEKNRGK